MLQRTPGQPIHDVTTNNRRHGLISLSEIDTERLTKLIERSCELHNDPTALPGRNGIADRAAPNSAPGSNRPPYRRAVGRSRVARVVQADQIERRSCSSASHSLITCSYLSNSGSSL